MSHPACAQANRSDAATKALQHFAEQKQTVRPACSRNHADLGGTCILHTGFEVPVGQARPVAGELETARPVGARVYPSRGPRRDELTAGVL